MSESAKVSNLDALRGIKAAFQSFQEEATVALSEATSDAQRSLWFISNDCKSHWQRELKKRNEKLAQAKAELFKKQLESNDTRTSAVVERKHVQRWEAAVVQAEDKLRAIKKWTTALERDFMMFKAGVQGMSNIVASDLPNATARIERMIQSLEAYIHLAAPSESSAIAASSDAAAEVASDAPPSGKSDSSLSISPAQPSETES